MIKLSKESIDEFKAIYIDKFGVPISDAYASVLAHRLISLYEIIYGSQNPKIKLPKQI